MPVRGCVVLAVMYVIGGFGTISKAVGSDVTEAEVTAAASKAREFEKASDPVRAAGQYAIAVDLSLRVHGLEHGTTFGLMYRHAKACTDAGAYEKAERLFEGVLKTLEQTAPNDPTFADAIREYAKLLHAQNRKAEADVAETVAATIGNGDQPASKSPLGVWESIRAAAFGRPHIEEWKQGDRVPGDRCVFDIQSKEGATIQFGGRDLTKFGRYACIVPGKSGFAVVPLTIRYPRRPAESRRLIAQGGKSIRVPLLIPEGEQSEVVLQSGHASVVYSVGFRPVDGGRVLTASSDGTVAIWETETGRKVRTLPGRKRNFAFAAFSPDGKQVAATRDDHTVALWDASTGELIRTFKGHTEEILSLAFSPMGDRLVTGSSDQTARIWEVATGKTRHILRGHTQSVTSVSFAGGGAYILTGSDDNTAALWDAATGGRKKVYREGNEGVVKAVAFSPDSKRVGIGSAGQATVWNVDGDHPVFKLDTYVTAFSLAFSPDGKTLAACGLTEVRFWDMSTGKLQGKPQTHKKFQFGFAFSPDGRRFLTGGADRGALLWDRTTGELVQTFRGHGDAVNSLAFSPDGRHLLTANGSLISASGSVLLWDLANGRGPRSFTGPMSHSDLALFAPDGGVLSCYAFANVAVLWGPDAAEGDGGKKFSQSRRSGSVYSVAISKDKRYLATGHGFLVRGKADWVYELIVWDVANAKPGPALSGHTDRIISIAFSPDAATIYSASWDGTVCLWDRASGTRRRTIKQGNPVTAMALSPTGDRLVTAGNSAAVWDTKSGNLIRVVAAHNKPIRGVAFSPDGRRILTAAADVAVLWDVDSGVELHRFRGHKQRITSVAFHPSGQLAATGSEDGTVRLWDCGTGEEVVQVIGLDGGSDWIAATRQGLFEGSKGGREKVSYRVKVGNKEHVDPMERFIGKSYYPGLMAAVNKGRRPMPAGALGRNPAPKVSMLVVPADGAAGRGGQYSVKVSAEDRSGGVGGVWLQHNQRGIKLQDEAATVQLIPGLNRFKAWAVSRDGAWESEPAELTLSFAGPSPPARLYALVVGVSQYSHSPERSAQAVTCDLAAEQFERLIDKRAVRGSPNPVVRPLRNTDATKARIIAELKKMATLVRPQDYLLVYLAGHGEVDGQRYYFLPSDFQDQAGRVGQALREHALAADELGELMGGIRALRRVLVVDSCHSGALTDLADENRNPFAFQRDLELLAHAQGIYCLAASTAGDIAKPNKNLGAPLMTYALLAGLKGVEKGPLAASSPVSTEGPGRLVDVRRWFSYTDGKTRWLYDRYYGQARHKLALSAEGPSFSLPLSVPSP